MRAAQPAGQVLEQLLADLRQVGAVHAANVRGFRQLLHAVVKGIAQAANAVFAAKQLIGGIHAALRKLRKVSMLPLRGGEALIWISKRAAASRGCRRSVNIYGLLMRRRRCEDLTRGAPRGERCLQRLPIERRVLRGAMPGR
ncbi:hypothetical protein D3C78_1201350 [compost metagenome]